MKNLDLSNFPKTDKQHWLQLAQAQLKGEDPLEKLIWETSGVSDLLPYYDQSDISSLGYLSDFFESIESHRWKLYEHVQVIDAQSANKKALEALMGGCDGVIFSMNQKIDVASLLNNIDGDICDLSFFSKEALPSESISGIFKNSEDSNCVFETQQHHSPIDQLIDLLTNIHQKKYIYRTAFKDFFLEVATLRALRYLTSCFKEIEDIHLHTTISRHELDDHQWFLNTTAGLASILGGSHSIALSTAMGEDRITRNVGNIIRDESGITTYEDQCGGSYFIDTLTDKIIQSVKNELK